jgi:23S rRNA pseudouridine2604 synthase
MSEEGVRLAKRVAASQVCSRREAEELIAAGAVQVNGEVVTDPARRVLDGARVQVLAQTAAQWGVGALTVLLHKPAGARAVDALRAAWPALGLGPAPVASLLEHQPLPVAAAGLSAWSNDRAMVRRLQDRERPLELEWLLTLPVAAAGPVITELQAGGVRASLGHERDGVGQWRLVDKGDRGAELVDFLDRGQFRGLWTLRRQRVGRMGLSPLAAGQARLQLEFERF